MRLDEFLAAPALLIEKVVGRLAIAYHRTKSPDTVQMMVQTGFRRGKAGMYGDGVYATYDYDSQQTPYMVEQYGPIIVKLKVNLAGFLILDRDVAKTVYGDEGLLVQFRANPKMMADRRYRAPGALEALASSIEQARDASEWTSDLGDAVLLKHRIAHLFPGMVYTGRQDGRCLIAYDVTHTIPMAWAECPADKLGTPERDLPWHAVDRREAVRTSLAARMSPEISGDLGALLGAVAAGKLRLAPEGVAAKCAPFPMGMLTGALHPLADLSGAEPIFRAVAGAPWLAGKIAPMSAYLLWRTLNQTLGVLEHQPTPGAIAYGEAVAHAVVAQGFKQKAEQRFGSQWESLRAAMLERPGAARLPWLAASL